jgi:hypothetical protein
LPEWNLSAIVKKHVQKLLRYKNAYWKKRYTINRVKLGDECPKFFHAMAIGSYRKNTITSLKDEAGNLVSDHDGKAALLWIAYKNRLGVTVLPQMQFSLDRLFSITVDLESLVAPFLKEEIDIIIKHMPIDKAPSPDGFNGLFIKKCWSLIKDDFYKLCEDFLTAK